MLLSEMFGIDKRLTRVCGHYLEILETSVGILLPDSYLQLKFKFPKGVRPNVMVVLERQEQEEY